MRFTDRLGRISASPTMAVMQEAQDLRARGIDVIDLGPGQPDFPTPPGIKRAGIRAIEDNFTNYTPAAGIKELRQAVADLYNREWGTSYDFSNVLITAGAKHGIYDICMTVFQKGDEVLIPSPYWVTFPEVVKIAEAVPVEIKTPETDNFILSRDHLGSSITALSKGLIINTPNNPTGAVIPEENLEEIVETARNHGLFLLADETYDRFTYGGKRHTSLAAFVNDNDLFCIVGSFSKTYAMTGWRMGYCLGPAELVAKMNEFQSHQSGNPCSISQRAALVALELGSAAFEEMRTEYERRRKIVLSHISGIPGFSCAEPDGAFYVFPNVSVAMQEVGCTTSQDFSKFLLQEARVATVPGSAFGMEGYIRLSYATSVRLLEQGLARIRKAVVSRPSV